VTNLDFITPVLTDGAPPPESPMVSAARRSGATVGVRDGWIQPLRFGEPDVEQRTIADTVAFADASPLCKTELQGPAEQLATRAGGLTLGLATAHEGAWWCPLTPTRALVLGARPGSSDLDGFSVLDVTTQFCALRIAGPRTRELMSRFCALDLRAALAPPGSLRPGSVARTPGLVLVEAPNRLLVMVGAALAEYFWTVVADAAGRLGGGPVAADLLAPEIAALEEAAESA
jgi:hypothetical protein